MIKLICLFWLLFFVQPLAVSVRYEKEYKTAFEFCKSITLKTDSIAKKFNLNSTLILPIVFPECMRYSIVKDHLETNTLNALYVNFGNKYADFSIGRFQMKPSFIEMLEKEVLSNPELSKEFLFIINYSSKENAKIRTQRVSRLTQINWQVYYLCCFYKVAEKRFSKLKFNTEESKINFYATAYNSGFWKTITDLKKQQKLPTFPGGTINYEKNYPYGIIATDYYKKCLFKI